MYILSKSLQRKIIDTCVYYLKSSNLSAPHLGLLIRTLHMQLTINSVKCLLYSSHKEFIWTIILLFIALLMFITFDGCILSKIEYKIDGLNITVMDYWLYLFNIEITNQSRLLQSYIMAMFYFSAVLFIYVYRFSINDQGSL